MKHFTVCSPHPKPSLCTLSAKPLQVNCQKMFCCRLIQRVLAQFNVSTNLESAALPRILYLQSIKTSQSVGTMYGTRFTSACSQPPSTLAESGGSSPCWLQSLFGFGKAVGGFTHTAVLFMHRMLWIKKQQVPYAAAMAKRLVVLNAAQVWRPHLPCSSLITPQAP